MAEEHPQEQPMEQPPVSGPLQIDSTPDDRTMALVAHLGGGLAGFLVPLIVWLIKKDQSKFVDDQGKEALNFQITRLLAHIILAPFACIPFVVFIIIPLQLAVFALSVVFGIIGGLAAQKGEVYRYPFALRLIK